MERKSEFEKIFKQKLEGYESGVPEDLWVKIQQKRKRRLRVFPWILLALMLTAGGWMLREWMEQPVSEAAANRFDNKSDKKDIPVREISSREMEDGLNSTEVVPEAISKENNVEKGEKNLNKEYKNSGNRTAKTLLSASSDIPSMAVAHKRTEMPLPAFGEVSVSGVEMKDALSVEMIEMDKIDPLTLPPPHLSLPLPEDCFDFGGSSMGSIYAELLGAPELAFRQLKNSYDNETDDYLHARDSTETSWYAFSASARLGVRFKSGLILKAGVNYTQINEIFEFRSGEETREVIVTIKDNEGNFIRNDTVVETGSLYKKTYNRYRMWDIPLMAGYEYERKKWTVGVLGGVYLNLKLKTRGELLSYQGSPKDFHEGAPVFKEKIGASFSLNTPVSYRIARNLHWQVEPQLRYFPFSFSDKIYMEQRYWNIALFTGLRYYISCENN